jgi:hypothetical protein
VFTPGTAAMCHCTKSLRDSGGVRLVLSVFPREEIAGSGGSRMMTGLRFLFRVTLRRLDLAEEVYHIFQSPQ